MADKKKRLDADAGLQIPEGPLVSSSQSVLLPFQDLRSSWPQIPKNQVFKLQAHVPVQVQA